MVGGAAAYLGEPLATRQFVNCAHSIVVTSTHTYLWRAVEHQYHCTSHTRVDVHPTTDKVSVVSGFLVQRMDLERRDPIQRT